MTKQIRHSAQREKLYNLLCSVKSHPNAEWLYHKLKEENPGIGIATVYRNLEFLKSQGKIIEVTVLDGSKRYDANPSPHLHFCCKCCGGVFDIDAEYDSALANKLTHGTGFVAESYQLELHGFCPDCALKNKVG